MREDEGGRDGSELAEVEGVGGGGEDESRGGELVDVEGLCEAFGMQRVGVGLYAEGDEDVTVVVRYPFVVVAFFLVGRWCAEVCEYKAAVFACEV